MLADRASEIEALLADPAVHADGPRVRSLSLERASLTATTERYWKYRRLEKERSTLQESLTDPGLDAEYRTLAETEIADLDSQLLQLLDELVRDVVTAEDREIGGAGSVILEIRAGVGGDEAALWVGDLADMYRRFATARGWRTDEMDFAPGDAGGFRSILLNVRGEDVWTALGYEGGTHQVKRVPATETQGRVHTSTATVAVMPEPAEIQMRVDPSEVQETITTAQGPGGQNVNKVATAVRLLHLPTGIEVRMQESKSQHQNREKAWKLLRARLYEMRREEAEKQRSARRLAMIGSGGRAEKIRTYRYKENVVVDHRIGQSFNLGQVLEGGLGEITEALVRHDLAQRISSL